MTAVTAEPTERHPLRADDFAEFFRCMNSKPDDNQRAQPFRWQERFVREVIDQGLPGAVSLPTAAGKTTILDIILFAIAARRSGAEYSPHARPLPRRLFFCVDRRLIVDQTARHALQLSERMNTSDSHVVRRVCYWLSEGREDPFVLFNWRGGLHLAAHWETDPMAVVVCVATVDQVGSRLLFRGYGSSAKHRPVFAAVVGLDSAIVLDEAHLSAPFLQTACAVEVWQRCLGNGDSVPIPALQVVQLGATLDTKPDFELKRDEQQPERDEWNDPGLRPRLNASKTLRLVNSAKPLVERIVRDVRSAVGIASRIAVVVSSVRLARNIFDHLNHSRPKAKGTSQPAMVSLLTGRNRPLVRDQIAKEVEAVLRLASLEQPAIIVATQCIEAGYDVSFDRLISDFPVIASLIQRLGRLNRYGEFGAAEAIVHYRPEEKSVYGETLEEHWRWAKRHLVSAGGQDVSPVTLAKLCKEHPSPTLDAPHTPVLLAPHLDVLSLTNPLPAADLDIESFLHGQDEGQPDVQVVWRADLNDGNPERWSEIVGAVPPRMQEAVSVPIYEVRRWLAARASGEEAEATALTDTDCTPDVDSQQRTNAIADAIVYQWQGRDEEPICELVRRSDQIVPGAFVIVPAIYGGCDRFGWAPEDPKPVEDIGDLLLAQRHRRIRLHPRVHTVVSEADARRMHQSLNLQAEGAEPEIDPLELAVELCNALAVEFKQGDLSPEDSLLIRELEPHPSGLGTILHIRKPSPWSKQRYVETLLDPHQQAVADRLAAWTDGFSPEYQAALRFAALHHDDGKADPRQQSDFHGGDEAAAEAWMRQGHYLAKPRVRPPVSRRLPRGCRHEMASVAIAEQLQGASELAFSVIGSHHGRGRALVLPHRDPRPMEIERHGVRISSSHRWLSVGSGWLDIFARLSHDLGPYRLAYLQSLLILADERQSAEEQEDDE